MTRCTPDLSPQIQDLTLFLAAKILQMRGTLWYRRSDLKPGAVMRAQTRHRSLMPLRAARPPSEPSSDVRSTD